jgi:hypothetical protein
MPSKEVSIGEDPPEEVGWRASWKEGVRVSWEGIWLAGRAAWSVFQKVSETMVRAREAFWDAETASSISSMVESTIAGGM